MSSAECDDEGAGDNGGNNGGGNDAPFVYTGQCRFDVLRDVAHVVVDPSAEVIGQGAFKECEQLVEVELCEGLDRIEKAVFQCCRSLKQVEILISDRLSMIASDWWKSCFAKIGTN